MTSIIESLIGEREEESRLAREAKEKKKAETIEALKASMKDYLGDFWKFLEERYQRTGEKYLVDHETNNGEVSKIFYHLPAMPEHELAPIEIKWSNNSLRSHYYDAREIFKVGGYHFSDLKDALAEARKRYPGYVEEQKSEAIKAFRNSIPSYWSAAEIDEEAIRGDLEKLVSDYPSLEEEAREHLRNWKKARAEHLRHEEENRRERETEKANRALLHTIRTGYVSELAAYLKEYDETLEANKAAAARMQETLDVAMYEVYKLNYAVVSIYHEDGEEYREIETRFAYTLQEKPSGGYWDIDGKKIQYLQAFSLEQMTVKPSEGILAKKVKAGEVTIYFNPTTADESTEAVFDVLSPLPEEPNLPDELRGEYLGDIRREARALLRGESGEEALEEVPF